MFRSREYGRAVRMGFFSRHAMTDAMPSPLRANAKVTRTEGRMPEISGISRSRSRQRERWGRTIRVSAAVACEQRHMPLPQGPIEESADGRRALECRRRLDQPAVRRLPAAQFLPASLPCIFQRLCCFRQRQRDRARGTEKLRGCEKVHVRALTSGGTRCRDAADVSAVPLRADFPRRSSESAASANATARTKSTPSVIPISTLATIPNIDVLIAHRTHRQVSHRRADDHRHSRHDIDSVRTRVRGDGSITGEQCAGHLEPTHRPLEPSWG